MVSQLTMPRIFGLFACLTALFLFVPACGQNEGGRCQVNSDCGSGLYCSGNNLGDGICTSNASRDVISDASTNSDVMVSVDEGSFVSVDGRTEETAVSSPQVDAEVVVTPARDATVLDGTAIDAGVAIDAAAVIDASAVIDAGAVDSGSFDSIGLD
jgi:hypothetical protein